MDMGAVLKICGALEMGLMCVHFSWVSGGAQAENAKIGIGVRRSEKHSNAAQHVETTLHTSRMFLMSRRSASLPISSR